MSFVTLIWQMLAKFSGVEPERTASKFTGLFTHCIKLSREMRKIHVAVVQRWLRNVQKSVMHVRSCFANINLLLFCRFRCRRRCRCQSSLLLWSRNSGTMVTWRHTSPLYWTFFCPSPVTAPDVNPRGLCESLLDPVPFSVYRYLVSLTFLFLLDAEFILPTALWFIQGRGGTTSGPNHPHIWGFWNLSQQFQWWSMLLIKTWLSWAKRSKKVQQKGPSVFIFPFTIFPSLSRPFLCPPRKLQNVRLSI